MNNVLILNDKPTLRFQTNNDNLKEFINSKKGLARSFDIFNLKSNDFAFYYSSKINTTYWSILMISINDIKIKYMFTDENNKDFKPNYTIPSTFINTLTLESIHGFKFNKPIKNNCIIISFDKKLYYYRNNKLYESLLCQENNIKIANLKETLVTNNTLSFLSELIIA